MVMPLVSCVCLIQAGTGPSPPPLATPSSPKIGTEFTRTYISLAEIFWLVNIDKFESRGTSYHLWLCPTR